MRVTACCYGHNREQSDGDGGFAATIIEMCRSNLEIWDKKTTGVTPG